MARRRSYEDRRWDDRRLPERIKAEARFRQIDLSQFVTMREATWILGASPSVANRRYLWLEGVEICGRKFVKRKRVEWLRDFRNGTLRSNDMMGESLAPYDVHAQIRANEEEKERKRLEAEAARPKGLHVDAYGKFWVDYDANDTWIPTRYAVINLGILRHNVRRLANRGRIARRWADAKTWQPVEAPPGNKGNCHIRAMYSLRDIERYLARKEKRGRYRNQFNLNDPDRPHVYIRLYPMEISRNERKLISREEAATILGVSGGRVSALISSGKLKAYTEEPGKHGRVWFSEDQVKEYANDPARIGRRMRYMKYVHDREHGQYFRPRIEPYRPEFGKPAIEVSNRSLHKDHGEYYSLRQAAHVLQCSIANVRNIVKSGILEGSR